MPNSCLTNCCGEGNSLPCLRPKFCRMGPREERPSGFLITCNRYHRSETSDQRGRRIILAKEYTGWGCITPAAEASCQQGNRYIAIIPKGQAWRSYQQVVHNLITAAMDCIIITPEGDASTVPSYAYLPSGRTRWALLCLCPIFSLARSTAGGFVARQSCARGKITMQIGEPGTNTHLIKSEDIFVSHSFPHTSDPWEAEKLTF